MCLNFKVYCVPQLNFRNAVYYILFLYFKNIFKKLIFLFLNYFNTLILKINFLK